MSARNCDVCLRRWDFSTDWLGRVHAIHPIGVCTPPVYRGEPLRIPTSSKPIKRRRCDECKEMFTPSSAFVSTQVLLCSAECRNARRTRRRHEQKQDAEWWSNVIAKQNARRKERYRIKKERGELNQRRAA